jgi:hypothetical protein
MTKARMAKKNILKKDHPIPTAGEIFHDGTAIELVRDPSGSEKFTLVRCYDDLLETNHEVLRDNRIFVPIAMTPSVARAIRFPTRVALPESVNKLFMDVHALLQSHLGQLDGCTTAIVFAIFASWLSPVLPMAPVFSIFAPVGSPKDLVLQMLSMLCRRPLRLVGLRRGDLRRVPTELHPTLLLDEPDLTASMRAILHASARRGAYILDGDRVLELFGPTIVCSSKPTNGSVLGTDAFRVALIPVSRQCPLLDKRAEEEIAGAFQARFLRYFLQNFRSVGIPKFDVCHLGLDAQNVARALGAAVVGDAELQERILPILAIRDAEIRTERSSSLDSLVLEAILFFIHQGGWSKVRTQQVAEKVAEISKGRGCDSREPSPEIVGWAIKRLGIPSGRINRAGNGVELTVSVCRLIHMLAVSYGVPALQQFHPGCRYCEESELASKQRQSSVGDDIA